MTPEYINELADMVDPSLWRLSPFDQMKLPPGMRKALDAGVALRRHAAHVARLRDLLNEGKSLLITPLSLNGSALRTVETPPDHRGMQKASACGLTECAGKPMCTRHKARDGGMPGDPDERHLRLLLAYRVAMPGAYYDDGEAQGQEHGITIDFMRDPVDEIDAKLRMLNVARAECAKMPNV